MRKTSVTDGQTDGVQTYSPSWFHRRGTNKEHLCKVWWKSIHRKLSHKAEGKIICLSSNLEIESDLGLWHTFSYKEHLCKV